MHEAHAVQAAQAAHTAHAFSTRIKYRNNSVTRRVYYAFQAFFVRIFTSCNRKSYIHGHLIQKKCIFWSSQRNTDILCKSKRFWSSQRRYLATKHGFVPGIYSKASLFVRNASYIRVRLLDTRDFLTSRIRQCVL